MGVLAREQPCSEGPQVSGIMCRRGDTQERIDRGDDPDGVPDLLGYLVCQQNHSCDPEEETEKHWCAEKEMRPCGVTACQDPERSPS